MLPNPKNIGGILGILDFIRQIRKIVLRHDPKHPMLGAVHNVPSCHLRLGRHWVLDFCDFLSAASAT